MLKDWGPEAEQAIKDALALFPGTFGLRGFPGKVFRMSASSSFVGSGQVWLYSEVQDGEKWLSFAKGTVEEFNREVVR